MGQIRDPRVDKLLANGHISPQPQPQQPPDASGFTVLMGEQQADGTVVLKSTPVELASFYVLQAIHAELVKLNQAAATE
jgi:hypothetical protein